MLDKFRSSDVLFLDIETVPQYPDYASCPENFRIHWERKAQLFRQDEQSPEELYGRAGIYAEFGKVICISCGYFTADGKFRMKSYYGHDEVVLLKEFAATLDQFCKDPAKVLCAHNGKEFDFPFLARRMLINGIRLPAVLDTAGKKPWEVNHLDTMELWKFGDYKSYTRLDLLAAVFNIPTPKDDIDGSEVGGVYWIEKDLERIVNYCQKDVLTVAQIFRRFRGELLVPAEDIEITK